jgi:small subunit ribosomal protein S7
MPRRTKIERRVPAPDARFNSEVLARFINKVMERGKKGTAEGIVYGALDRIAERTGRHPMEVFEQALGNATPVIEVKPRRVGGATYQVPVEIRGDRRMSLGVRWLVQAARKRNGKSMSEKLAAEFVDASNGLGAAVKRREDTHKMADANKAFSHFKW